ncbi:hypothetical protein [Ramlibacter sp.]|uniref:hypothetical protein n=1 Tax=Ramlibacter sp. TaxID=1917967 RepID=UPI0035AF84E9
MEETGATKPYELESLLLDAYGLDLGERCGVFNRMENLGEPDIEKKLPTLATDPANAAQWLYHATLYAPEAFEVLNEPVWRLLDPRPTDRVELRELRERHYPFPAMTDTVKVVISDPAGFDEDDDWVHIATGLKESRQGLTRALQDMRQAELDGLLHRYHLHLLTAMERVSGNNLDPGMQLLQPDGADYLAACFGRVEVHESSRKGLVIETRLGLSAYLGADPFGAIAAGGLEWCPR